MNAVRLGDLCTKITDGSHSSPQGQTSGVPMYSVKDMTEYGFEGSNAKLISEDDHKKLIAAGCKPEVGDVLIAKDGSVLKHVFVYDSPEECSVLSSIAILRPDRSKINPRYLSYSLKNPNLRASVLENYVSGSGVPRIVLKDFKEIQLPVVSLPQQEVVVRVLGILDSKIRLNAQISANLEELARTIFKSWFIDFDPVHAKARGERPEGMDAETAALFPDSFEESELGLIPRGWRVTTVGSALTVQGGSTPSTNNPEYWGGPHTWTTPKDMAGLTGIVSLSSARSLTDEGLARITSGMLKANAVLMSSRAPIGYVAITDVPTAINQGIVGIAPHEDFHALYLANWLKAMLPEIESRAGGSSFAEISKASFKTMPFLAPAPEVLLSYREFCEPVLGQLKLLAKQGETLREIRDSLLPRLISGELQIPEELQVD